MLQPYSAFKQLETYKATIPSLFTYNGILIISDGLETKAGSLSAGLSRFMAWKTKDGLTEASHLEIQLITLIKGMLNKKTILDLIRHFIVFEKNKKEDLNTGIITIQTVKKLAGYHQYYAVNKAVDNTLIAASEKGDGKEVSSGTPREVGNPYPWCFTPVNWCYLLNNPTIVVITDRNDLDDQLFDTFAASTQLLRQTPVQAEQPGTFERTFKSSIRWSCFYHHSEVSAGRRQ